MSKIQVGESEHSFCGVTAGWIHQQVNDRQNDKRAVCARIMLNSDSVCLSLATPQCAHGPGSSRPLTGKEEEIFRIWQQEHLDQPGWTAGNLNAFVKRVQRLTC